MPAATNKTDLLAVTEKEFGKLLSLLDSVPANAAMIKVDETSIKDVIAHRAHWIDLFLGWYRDGRDGKDVSFPAKGYKWNELARYNSALRISQTDVSWQQAGLALQEAHKRLTEFLEFTSNDALYGGPMKGAHNNWTAGRWAEAAGPSHYRSAAKYIRSRLRQMK